MNIDKLFPYIIIALSFLASLVCFCCYDLRRGIYWLAAAVLNAAVTF